MPFLEKIFVALISIIALLPALTVHEWAHGFMAYKLGDRTAKLDGRLSLNPLDHLDPVGSLMLLLVGFGWAKPVPVMTRNFKKPKRDFALTSLAGPLSNFILGFISVFFALLFIYLGADRSVTLEAITLVFSYSAAYNIGLGLFNLIPIPPLDGSNIVMCILPNHLAAKYSQIRYYTRYIFLAIVLLSYLPGINVFAPLTIARGWIEDLFFSISNLILSPIFG